ncbi:hypothetical protein ABAC402_04065 [Asticcacaulis sp. AC402]|nr:hypothetical protein ABAC402_04065 [Asticcacaulis sp. AC402]
MGIRKSKAQQPRQAVIRARTVFFMIRHSEGLMSSVWDLK